MNPEPQDFRYCPHCGAKVVLKLLKSGEPERHVCDSCEAVHFLGPKLAAGVIFTHDNRIVLTRRDIEPGRGLFTYPGGFVERGEMVMDAAVREAREEACAEVAVDGILGVYSYARSNITVVIYRGHSIGEEPKAGDEVQEVKLYQPSDIPWAELAFQSVRDSLKDFLKWNS